MVREQRSFDQAYLRHLPIEQRKTFLRAIRDQLDPETTVGEVVDAAKSLGFAEELGEVMLLQLAKTLLGLEDEEEDPRHHLRDLSPGARRLQSALALRFVDWDETAESEAMEVAQADAAALEQEVAKATEPEATEPEQDELSESGEASAELAEENNEPVPPRRARKKRSSKKRSSKKRSAKKKSSKKRSAKKRSSKTATKKKSSKRGAKKKATKKRSAKKRAVKKRSSTKKSGKRSAKKKATKKRSSKRRRA